jgi:carbon storage regulator
MLILSRKLGEQIQIGSSVALTVVDIGRRTVKLGLTAPIEIRIRRGELPELEERPATVNETLDYDPTLFAGEPK